MAKTATITLDKERTLAFPIMSLIKLEKEHGVKLTDLQDPEKAQDFSVILAIIWAGLIHEDRELSYEDLGYLVDLTDLPAVTTALGEVFNGMSDKELKK